MENRKKMCLFPSISIIRGGVSESEEKRYLQNLPPELLVKIFGYLPLKEAVSLQHGCSAFRVAVSLHLWWTLIDFCSLAKKHVQRCKKALEVQSKPVSQGIFKKLESWRSLDLDLSMLMAMIWRYYQSPSAWSSLAAGLEPVLTELKLETNRFCNGCYKNIKHPKLVQFLKKFTSNVDAFSHYSDVWASFEVKLVELFFSCPHGNLNMTVKRAKDSCFSTKIYYELKDTRSFVVPPKIKPLKTKLQKELEILKFLREFIRKGNVSYIRSERDVTSILNLTSKENVQYSLKQDTCGNTEEIYTRNSSMNLSYFTMYCTVETTLTRKPVFFKKMLEERTNEEINEELIREVVCIDCNHQNAAKKFSLDITNAYTGVLRTCKIIYDAIADDYKLYIRKYKL